MFSSLQFAWEADAHAVSGPAFSTCNQELQVLPLTAANVSHLDGSTQHDGPIPLVDALSENSLGDLPTLCSGSQASSHEPCFSDICSSAGSDTKEDDCINDHLEPTEVLGHIATIARGLLHQDDLCLDAPAKRYRVNSKMPNDCLYAGSSQRGKLYPACPDPVAAAPPFAPHHGTHDPPNSGQLLPVYLTGTQEMA